MRTDDSVRGTPRKRFIEGRDRSQRVLLPYQMDDYVVGGNSFRVVDVFVDELHLAQSVLKESAQQGAQPITHRFFSRFTSTAISIDFNPACAWNEKHGIRWTAMAARPRPDFKTIANFYKANGRAVSAVCRHFVVLCRRLGLSGEALVELPGWPAVPFFATRGAFSKASVHVDDASMKEPLQALPTNKPTVWH